RHCIADQAGKGETMSFHSWLQNLRSAFAPSQRRHRRRGSLRTRTHGPNLEVLEDRLTPSFSPATSFPVGPNPQVMVAADFNNAGTPDLATATDDANAALCSVRVLPGDARGGVGPAIGSAGGSVGGAKPVSLAVADFNKDGNLDLAMVSSYRNSET